jgi:hypothetical protein
MKKSASATYGKWTLDVWKIKLTRHSVIRWGYSAHDGEKTLYPKRYATEPTETEAFCAARELVDQDLERLNATQ